MRPILFIGGGGHCKSVIAAAESSGRTIFGILDIPENVGREVLGYKIIGTDDDIVQYIAQCDFVVTVGQIKDSSIRENLHQKLSKEGGILTTIVASSAIVSRHATIGQGTVILHGAVIDASATIGNNCIVNTLANVGHDAVVGDFSHISTGAMVNGNCTIGNGVFLGSQSVMLNGISICDKCIVSAGSFVRKSIKYEGIYAGNPAILVKRF